MVALLTLLATVPPLGLRNAKESPALSGPETVIDGAGFRIRYTTEGVDAPSPRDADGNGVPDLVDQVAKGLVAGFKAFAAEGWRAPQGSVVDDEPIDVAIREIAVLGYAYPLTQDDDAGCRIEIDPLTDTAGDVVTSVALHELHHCVQFRYATDLPSWLYEAAATFEQYSHVDSPLLDLALAALWRAEITTPESGLASVDGESDPYSAFLWMKFWTEYRADDGPELDRLPSLWEELAVSNDPWEARLDAASVRVMGSPLDRLFVDYATWNGFACNADVGKHYTSESLGCTANVWPAVTEAGLDERLVVSHGPESLAATTFEVVVDRSMIAEFACTEGDGSEWAWMHVTGDGVESRAYGRADELGHLPLHAGDVARAVVVSTSAPVDTECTVREAARPPTRKGCQSIPGALGGGSLGLLLMLGLIRRQSAGRM